MSLGCQWQSKLQARECSVLSSRGILIAAMLGLQFRDLPLPTSVWLPAMETMVISGSKSCNDCDLAIVNVTVRSTMPVSFIFLVCFDFPQLVSKEYLFSSGLSKCKVCLPVPKMFLIKKNKNNKNNPALSARPCPSTSERLLLRPQFGLHADPNLKLIYAHTLW